MPNPIDIAAQATPPTLARKVRGLSDRTIAWIFVAPTIFLLLAINIFPLIWTIRLSLHQLRRQPPERRGEMGRPAQLRPHPDR